MGIFLWLWFLISTATLFYVIFQVNIGKKMTFREVVFYFLGMFSMGVPLLYMLAK